MRGFRSQYARNMVSPREAEIILRRFELAEKNGARSVDCYLAAIDSWCRLHPNVRRQYAAACVVQVILGHRTKKIIDRSL
jgi:hypothetical protein